jgi:hypothetical protein
MIIAITNFTLQTTILACSITALTFVILRFEYLAAGLMFKLIVLAQEGITKGAQKNSATMRIHVAIAFNTNGLLQWT